MVEEQLDKLLRPLIEHMGFHLVQVKLTDGNKRRVLQIMIERIDGKGIVVDDCADVSHAVSAILDVNDPISGEYHLEVTSPGIDRPLVRLEDFVRFTGFEIKAETAVPLNGRKRYRGMLTSVEGENITIRIDGEDYIVPYAKITNAKLVMNDALLKAYQKGLITH